MLEYLQIEASDGFINIFGKLFNRKSKVLKSNFIKEANLKGNNVKCSLNIIVFI